MSKVKLMIKTLFPNTNNVDEVVEIVEKHRMKFGLDTNLRLAHFLAQVREEVGSEFKVVRENLNYKENALLKKWPKRISVEDAEKYGRDENTIRANQEAIANLVYSNRLGNGNADSDNDGDMDADDDGYKYRGAGCLQVTGKNNFAEVQKRCVAKTGVKADPDTLEGFVLFGMAFWLWQDLYKIADGGRWAVVVDNITKKINLHTDSYADRRMYFDAVKHLV